MGAFRTLRNLLTAEQMYRARPDEWEALCDRCCRCCFEREFTDEGTLVVNYAEPCPYLDLDARRCRVYDHRFEACDQCHPLTPRTAVFGAHLPPTCAYARRFRY